MTPGHSSEGGAATPVQHPAELPPRWLALPLTAALIAVVAASVVGVVAAMADAFTPPVVWIGTVLLAGPGTVLAVRALPRWSSSRSAHGAAAVVVAFAVAVAVYNGANHAQHLVADRDPGVYLTTARHLMDEGNVLVPGPVGPFVDSPGVSPNGAGFSPIRGDGTLEPQFPHLTAVTLALGGWVAETGLFLVTPMLAGFGLLCLYALTTTLAGARWAAVAVAVTGLTMPFTVFARDTYSEPITTVLVFGGLWLLHLAARADPARASGQAGALPVDDAGPEPSARRSVPHLALWLLAGLTLGATNMARVDGYLYLAPIALALALAVRLAPSGVGGATRRGALWCAAGVVVTSAVGLWDTATLTGGYYDEGLAPRLPAMLGAAVVAGLGGWFGAPHLWRRDGGDTVASSSRPEPVAADVDQSTTRAGATPASTADAGPSPPPAVGADRVPLQATPVLRGLLTAAAVGLAGFFAYLWWLRPDPGDLPDIATEGVNILSYLPQAATISMRWLGWYYGPVPLVFALAGLLWAVIELGRRRLDPAAVATLGSVLVTLLLYLWSPNITPDHPWAMRRFAAVAMPGLAIGIAVGCRALWAAGPRSGRARGAAPGALAALIVAGSTVASVAAITWPTREVRAQVPMRDRMASVCEILEPDDAVLVTIDGILSLMMSVPVGVWCDVPSAGATADLEPVDVARMAVEWAEQGRRLVVLSSSETPVFNTLRPSGIVTQGIATLPAHPVTIEPTLTSRPDEVVVDERLGKGPDGEITLYLYVIDLDRSRRLLRSDR